LRELIMKIKEQKQMEASLALEFDCLIDVVDVKPLVQVVNYAINYVGKLSEKPQHIALNSSISGITLSFTAHTSETDLPEINPQVTEVLKEFQGSLEQSGEPGSYTQILLRFPH
jgi:hypothetical protein